MARPSLRQTKDEIIAQLQEENQELQQIVDDYNARFDEIENSLPGSDDGDSSEEQD